MHTGLNLSQPQWSTILTVKVKQRIDEILCKQTTIHAMHLLNLLYNILSFTTFIVYFSQALSTDWSGFLFSLVHPTWNQWFAFSFSFWVLLPSVFFGENTHYTLRLRNNDSVPVTDVYLKIIRWQLRVWGSFHNHFYRGTTICQKRNTTGGG